MSIIRLEKIYKKYDEKVIFENFNLTIEEKEFVAFTGESGVGKSTLLNIIGLLEKPDSGDVYIHKEKNPSIYKSNGRMLLKNHISYLFQNYGLIENETVYNNLLISIKLKKLQKTKQKKDIEQALYRVGLEGFENKKIYKLSGGEQQRIALAKIILKKSDIILADEPTGSLDDMNKNEVLKILKKFYEEGKTVIVVTHDSVVSLCASRQIKI